MPTKPRAPQLSDLVLGRATMPERSFLRHLPAATWQSMIQERDQRIRSYDRDTQLPLTPEGRHVFIIVQGCVRQDRFPLGEVKKKDKEKPVITRFRGIGEIVGEAKLIDRTSSVTTKCLSKTYAIPWTIAHVHRLQDNYPEVRTALLRSLEDRIRQDEKVYATFTKAPLHRVSMLLAHLAETAGVPDPAISRSTIISGPTQEDLAQALQLGLSTVENAIGCLRRHGTVEAGYRKFIVHDLDALQDSLINA